LDRVRGWRKQLVKVKSAGLSSLYREDGLLTSLHQGSTGKLGATIGIEYGHSADARHETR
jgi:hypothetical protein